MGIYNKTKSYCPTCKKILDTDIVEKNGAMFMLKKCPEHGEFKVKIAKYAWYYKGLNDYYNSLFDKNFFKENQNQIYTASITSKCNLNCPICFAGSPNLPKKDMPIDSFKGQLSKIKSKGISIHFSGGEPTLREDLPELIKIVAESKNESVIFTNGIKIANDFEYLKLLKECGLKTIYLWMDTVKKPEIYEKMRGKNFIDMNKKALENIEKLKIPLRILDVVAKGVNESETGDLIEYAKNKEIVNCLYLRGYNYLGSCGFSPEQEFLIDELVESVASQSNNLFTLEDVYYCQKIFLILSVLVESPPHCSQAAIIYIPKNKEKPLKDIFRLDKVSKVLDEFEKIWKEDRQKAKKYISSSYLKDFFVGKDLLCQDIMKTKAGSCGPAPFKHYLLLLMSTMNNASNYDINRNQQECINRSFDLGVENNFPRCYEILNLYSR